MFKNAKTYQYAWNSAPIENSDVSHIVAAVGREFRFSLDIKLSTLPELNDKSNSTLHNYLQNVSSGAAFATSVVQVLVD